MGVRGLCPARYGSEDAYDIISPGYHHERRRQRLYCNETRQRGRCVIEPVKHLARLRL